MLRIVFTCSNLLFVVVVVVKGEHTQKIYNTLKVYSTNHPSSKSHQLKNLFVLVENASRIVVY